MFSVGRAWLLDRDSVYGPYLNRNLAFGGTFLSGAVGYSGGMGKGIIYSMMGWDLRTGRKLYSASVDADQSAGTDLPQRIVVDASSGSAAWSHGDAESGEVNKWDASSFRTLDPGPGVDPESLSIEGSTVSWTNAGQRRQATLAGPPFCGISDDDVKRPCRQQGR